MVVSASGICGNIRLATYEGGRGKACHSGVLECMERSKGRKKLSIQGREQVHNWISDKKGDCLEREFDGGRIAVVGKTDGNGGYATISISDANGKVLDKLFVDFYSKIPDEGLRFVSKNYPKGKYRLRIEVTGTQSAWYNKKKTIRYGSHGYLVNVTKTIEMEADV